MRRFRQSVLVASLLAVLGGPARADATTIDRTTIDRTTTNPVATDPASRSAIQAVITKQLDALSREDGTAAEAFASQGIRDKFSDGAAFMAMVHKSYAALLHPKSTAFGQIQDSPHGPLQPVTVVAADGTIWTAIYSLEKVDGSWRITGCGLQREAGQMDI